MRFRFSLRITLVCSILALLMVRASIWQWQRHIEKRALIQELEGRLKLPVQPLAELLDQGLPPEALLYRRVAITGSYDFSHEMVLRNRRLEEHPGVFALTPLQLPGKAEHLLVSRGFIPFEHTDRSARVRFHTSHPAAFIGLIKPDNPRRFLAPRDPPTGGGQPWVDAWLRVDIERMQQQLPYRLLPFYVEVMANAEDENVLNDIVRSDSKREDVIFNMLRAAPHFNPRELREPAPVYDAIIPAGRHLGYVYEWAFLATLTILIGVILQLRRPAA